MTTTPPPQDSNRPFGHPQPGYGAAPRPGGQGHNPYSDTPVHGQAPGPGQPTGYAQAPHPSQQPHGGQPPGAPQSLTRVHGHGPQHGGSPPKRSLVGLVVAIVGVVLLLALVGVGWWAFRAWEDAEPGPTTSPTPSPTQTPDPTADPTDNPTGEPTDEPANPRAGEIADGRMLGAFYSYDLPDGWALADDSGDRNDGRTTDGQDTDVTVWNFGPGMQRCHNEVNALEVWVPGTIESLPDREVGGLPATGDSLTGEGGEYYELYCIEVDGDAIQISLKTTVAAHAGVEASFTEILDSWQWD